MLALCRHSLSACAFADRQDCTANIRHAFRHAAPGAFQCKSGSSLRPHSVFSVRRETRRRLIPQAAGDTPSLQLATAKLPKGVDLEAFSKALYDWASSMTSSGRNMPFSLPLRTRKKDGGFEISLLRVSNNQAVPVGHIKATVESEANVGDVLFVRFFEGEGAELVRSAPLPKDPTERLKTVVDGLVDVPLIMGTMRSAIKQAVTLAK